MAQVTEIRLVDDLDGGNADESVDFTVDNNRYQMDLSEKNAARLREVLAPSSRPHAAPAAPRLPAPAARSLPARPGQVRTPQPSVNGQARTVSASPPGAGSPPRSARPTRTGQPQLLHWLSKRRRSRPRQNRGAGHARRSPTHSPPSKHGRIRPTQRRAKASASALRHARGCCTAMHAILRPVGFQNAARPTWVVFEGRRGEGGGFVVGLPGTQADQDRCPRPSTETTRARAGSQERLDARRDQTTDTGDRPKLRAMLTPLNVQAARAS